LSYVGVTNLGGAKCQLLEGWDIDKLTRMTPFGTLIQWQIDAKTARPAEVRQSSNGFLMRTRFLYDAVNQPLPAKDFALPKVEGVSPAPPEPLDADYTNRFVNLRDGSDGRMSVRWGKQGPKRRSSSGLN
jgi:hypothetical protein